MWFFRKKSAEDIIDECLALIKQNKAEKALAKLEKVTERDPTHAEAWYYLGKLYSDLGDPEDAIECYVNSAQHADGELRALPLYNLGNVWQELGDNKKALECFERATQMDPRMADAWINRGRLIDDSGEHAKAIECYNTALRFAPKDTTALTNRGNSLRSLKRYPEAKASYEASLALAPEDFAALVGLGHCLAMLGEPQRGLTYIDKAVELSHHPLAMFERAIVLGQMKRYDDAIRSLDDAIVRGVRSAQAFNNRGELLAKLSKFDDAVKCFDEALKLDAQFAPALFGKARVLCRAKKYEPAKATIDLYFKCSSEDDDLREAANAIVSICADNGVA